MTLSVYVNGIGVIGPGLAGWRDTASVLRGQKPYLSAPTILAAPGMLPPAERRRTGRVVKVALGVALEATAAAGADAAALPSVFSSSGSDGQICHEICQALATAEREVSPTRFSNSVHNAPAGYWSIATGNMAEANVLCAYDASFVAGLLDAAAQASIHERQVLLVAYDTEYPEPLHAKRPIPDAMGVALVLCGARSSASQVRLEVELIDAPADTLEGALEDLRLAIPAARALPLLRLLARGDPGSVVLDYLPDTSARIRIAPCN